MEHRPTLFGSRLAALVAVWFNPSFSSESSSRASGWPRAQLGGSFPMGAELGPRGPVYGLAGSSRPLDASPTSPIYVKEKERVEPAWPSRTGGRQHDVVIGEAERKKKGGGGDRLRRMNDERVTGVEIM